MDIKSNMVIFFLIISAVFTGCFTNTEKKDIEKEEKNDEKIITYEESLINETVVEEINITNYFYNEIMNGNNDLSFQNGSNGVIDFFGNPLEENILPSSFNFEGGKIVEIHEYVYEDFIHRYYISESGYKLYAGFTINKKLDRLKTINIGDTSEKLLSVFPDKYYPWEGFEQIKENISYYTDPVVCEVQFVIKDRIILMIYCNFLLI